MLVLPLHRRLPAAGPVDEGVDGHGARNAVTLAMGATELLQHLSLFDGFHALGNHLLAKRAGQPDHPLHNGPVARVVQHALHEALVDLECVHGQAAQVGQ